MTTAAHTVYTTVGVSFRWFELLEYDRIDEALDLSDVPNTTGLVWQMDYGVKVWTGIVYGAAMVAVEIGAKPEALDAREPWEDIAECSLTFTTHTITVINADHSGDELPTVQLQELGPHRIRVSALGRDIAYDSSNPNPDEHYLIQIWPEETSPPSRNRATTGAAGAMIRIGENTSLPEVGATAGS